MNFAIRPATVQDGPGICRLFGRVFPREMTLEEWQWKYPRNPDGWLSVVAEVEGQVAGHYGGWAARVLMDGAEKTLFSLCDLSTDPVKRRVGGPHAMFLAMAEEWNRLLKSRGQPFSYGFPGPSALAAGTRRVGYRTHFPIRELRFPVGAESAGAAVATDFVGGDFDSLWDAARALVEPAGLVRDRVRVNWRYHARPDRSYRMVLVEEGGEPAAWAVFSLREGDALVVDFLARDSRPDTFASLRRAVAAEAGRKGARALVFWETPGGPWRRALLEELDRCGGTIADAGFSFATAALFDESAFDRFVRHLHLTPSFYDDR